MIFQNTCRNILIFSRKTSLFSKNYLSRLFYSPSFPKLKKKFSRYSNAVIASSVAVGLTIFITYKRNTLCEILDVAEKELQFITDYTYEDAIHKSRDLLQRVKDEVGAPGMVIGVSINGKTVWTEGLGYSDVENRVLCSADTVMRIASISKSITMAAVAKLWEQGKLDLDKPVQDYVPYFPFKTFNGKPVTITCRQLVSHLGGIRHYDKNSNATSPKKSETKVTDDKMKKSEKSEFDSKEYYIKEHFKDVKSSVEMFKDDPLIGSPGSKFYYSTHGWTLISAIVEAASKEQFSTHVTKLFKSLGMSSTYLDVNDTLIYYRARNYIKDKNGHLINAPFVDNSYKWAGGGFLSTVGDLLQFGNSMLYSLQFKSNFLTRGRKSENEENTKIINQNINNSSDKEISMSEKENLPGYLCSKTVEALWTPVTDAKDAKYGMGWFMFSEVNECQYCESKKFCVFHTGGAVGASSILLILPQSNDEINDLDPVFTPKGIIVTILTNLQSVQLQKTALKIAEIFDNIQNNDRF